MGDNQVPSIYTEVRLSIDKLSADARAADAAVKAVSANIDKTTAQSAAQSSKIADSMEARWNAGVRRVLANQEKAAEAAARAQEKAAQAGAKAQEKAAKEIQRIEDAKEKYIIGLKQNSAAIEKRRLDDIVKENEKAARKIQQEQEKAAKATAKANQTSPLSFRGINIPGTSMTANQKEEFKQYAAGALIAGSATLALGAAVVKLTKDYADYGSGIYHASQFTGIAAKDVSVLRFQAEQLGIPFDKITTALKFYAKQLADAEVGGKKQAAVLASLGISVQQVKDAHGQFLPLLDATAQTVAATGNSFEKAAILAKAFGRGVGPEMVEFLRQFAGASEEAKQQIRDMGLMFDDVSARKAQQFKQQLGAMAQSAKGLEIQLGQALAPAVLNLVPKIEAVVQGITRYVEVNPSAVQAAFALAGGLGAATTAAWGLTAAAAALDVELGGLPIIIGLIVGGLATMAIESANVGSAMAAAVPDGIAFENVLSGIAYRAKSAKDMLELLRREKLLVEAQNALGPKKEKVGELSSLQERREDHPILAGAFPTILPDFKESLASAQVDMIQADNAVKLAQQGLEDYRKEAEKPPPDIKPAGAGGKGKSEKQSTAVIEATRQLATAKADEAFRAFKAGLDAQSTALDASLKQNASSYQSFARDKIDLAGQMANAELQRLGREKAATLTEIVEVRAMAKAAKPGNEKEELLAKGIILRAKLIEIEGRYKTVQGEFAKEEIKLAAGQVEENKKLASQFDNTTIAQMKAMGGAKAFDAQRLEITKKYQDLVDKLDATDPMAKRILDAAYAMSALDLQTVDATESAKGFENQQKASSLAEKNIQASLALGSISQLQAKDALLQAQRDQIPAIEAEIKSLQQYAAQQQANDEDTTQTVEKIQELQLSLRTLGQDLEKAGEMGRILSQTQILPDHLNDGVIKLLADTKSLQQVLTDMRTNAAKSVFNAADEQIDKLLAKMPKALGFLKEFASATLKDLSSFGIAQLEERALGLKKKQTPQQATTQNTTTMRTLTSSNYALIHSLDLFNSMLSGASGGSSSPYTHESLHGNEDSSGDVNISGRQPWDEKLPTFGTPPDAVSDNVSGGSPIPLLRGAAGLGSAIKSGNVSDIASKTMGLAGSSIAKGIFGKLGGLFGLGAKSGIGGLPTDMGSAAGGMAGASEGALNAGDGAAGGATGAAGMAAMFSNPLTAALAIAPIAIPLIAGLFGGGNLKKIKDAIQSRWQIQVKSGALGDQLANSIQQQAQGTPALMPLKDHINDAIDTSAAKQLITAYAEQTGQDNNILVKTQQATDPNNASNNIQRRAAGGSVIGGNPYIVHDSTKPEIFMPGSSGHIYPDAREFMGAGRGNSGTDPQIMQYIQTLHATIRDMSDKHDAVMNRLQSVHPDTFFQFVTAAAVASKTTQGYGDSPAAWQQLARSKGI